MPLPINIITPALELLSEKIDILPASGGAIEDLQHPDEDELEDNLWEELKQYEDASYKRHLDLAIAQNNQYLDDLLLYKINSLGFEDISEYFPKF